MVKNTIILIQKQQLKKMVKAQNEPVGVHIIVVTKEPVYKIRSTDPYRLAVVWSAHSDYYDHVAEREEIKKLIPTTRTKTGAHHRHCCGNSWCCRPCHIKIGTKARK